MVIIYHRLETTFGLVHTLLSASWIRIITSERLRAPLHIEFDYFTRTFVYQ